MSKALLGACFILFACIEQIEIFNASNTYLVVDGAITSEPGPQKVRIYQTSSYNEKLKYEEIEDAVVKIIDDLDNEELLAYTSEGFFLSAPNFSGIVGRTYRINFTLASGKEYESSPELMRAVPEIDSIYYEKLGTDIVYSIDFQDSPSESNYYKWGHSETFEIFAPIAYEIATEFGELPSRDCFAETRPVNFNKLWRCWARVADLDPINIERDLLFDGRKMTRYQIFKKEIDEKFNDGYYAEIQQYSLTKEAYNFWEALEAQIGNTGTIFETSNYQIRGNVYAVDNKNELVLGYFSASAVSRKSVFIYDFIGTFPAMSCEVNNSGCYPERCMNCLKFSTSSTNVKPDYWPIE